MMINLYSRYLSQRDISLSSTNTSTHQKKIGQSQCQAQSKDKVKQKCDSVVNEQSSKAKLSTSINEIDQYYLDIINQKNKEIKKLKEEIESMKNAPSISNKPLVHKKRKDDISFEYLKKKQDEDNKSFRNSMREIFNCNSKKLSHAKIIKANCYILEPNSPNGPLVGYNLKQRLNNLKARAYKVMSNLSASNQTPAQQNK